MFENLEISLRREFPHYLVKVSQVKKSFYVLIRKRRGKILDEKTKQLFDIVENNSNSLYQSQCRNCKDLIYSFFRILNLSETTVIITSTF